MYTFEVKKFNFVSMSDVSLPAINLLDVRMFSNSSRPKHMHTTYIIHILNIIIHASLVKKISYCIYATLHVHNNFNIPVKLGLRDRGLKIISFQMFVNCGILTWNNNRCRLIIIYVC